MEYKHRVVIPMKVLSLNQMYSSRAFNGHAMTYMTTKGKQFKEEFKSHLRALWSQEPLDGKLSVRIICTFNDLRKHDNDNFSKAILDSGNGILWIDDSMIRDIHNVKLQKETKGDILEEKIIIEFGYCEEISIIQKLIDSIKLLVNFRTK